MPRNSRRPVINYHLPHFTQISESHCGPAVIQILLSNLGIEVSQESVAEAGGATDLIELNGMRVDQLAQAVYTLAPQVRFWYKQNSTLEELILIVSHYHYPVGVEWQGLFEDFDDDEGSEEEDDEDDDSESEDDYGHYSIITHVNRRKRQLIIADPYKDYISKDRIFSFREFEERWWDTNEVINPKTGRPHLVEDYHMMFILTPKRTIFPLKLEMKRY
jgi:hypothetical protein